MAGIVSEATGFVKSGAMEPQPISPASHSKVAAEFDIHCGPKITLPLCKGVIHLFEHKYNRTVTFWYGMAQLECAERDFMEPQKLAPSYRDVYLTVRLVDGRQGQAKYWQLEELFENNTRYLWVPLAGISPLVRLEDVFNLPKWNEPAH
jgi:hypothetical protein